MFENAKRYNVPNSAIYKRVLKMQQVMQVRAVEQSQGCNFSYEFISLSNIFPNQFLTRLMFAVAFAVVFLLAVTGLLILCSICPIVSK